MYAVFQYKKPIAFHDEKRVVEQYMESIMKCDSNSELKIKKISNRMIKKMRDYYDYYLIRIGDTYVQSKFYSIACENQEQVIYDLQYAKDVLYRTIEMRGEDLSNKEFKSIERTIGILEDEIKNEESKVLDVKSLESMQSNIDRWRRQYQDIFDAENKPWICG